MQEPLYVKFHKNLTNSFWNISEEQEYVLFVVEGLNFEPMFCLFWIIIPGLHFFAISLFRLSEQAFPWYYNPIEGE